MYILPSSKETRRQRDTLLRSQPLSRSPFSNCRMCPQCIMRIMGGKGAQVAIIFLSASMAMWDTLLRMGGSVPGTLCVCCYPGTAAPSFTPPPPWLRVLWTGRNRMTKCTREGYGWICHPVYEEHSLAAVAAVANVAVSRLL